MENKNYNKLIENYKTPINNSSKINSFKTTGIEKIIQEPNEKITEIKIKDAAKLTIGNYIPETESFSYIKISKINNETENQNLKNKNYETKTELNNNFKAQMYLSTLNKN